ncbi:Putative glutamine amidotransferase (plasmid) [Corynebacterium occultum]|uniref:Glutamine amidotransferase n=1 Tax=Corynebacterium occultum TaxID=2675219 RepID=A0A6B8VT02_9CORY|nr:gamma-glutamyl-gamma-aminobutyrate hydrolase family protein [Corynebacterium occultum]QGU08722.1 Putative glutamine amidotransferase [Corynebacterium occultum]
MYKIGIPSRLSSSPADKRVVIANQLIDLIADRLRSLDAEPILLNPSDLSHPPDLDALLLPGGGDISPHRYGQEPDPRVYNVDPEQDRLDFGMARHALHRNLPIMGICRGMQLLNVLYGGSLIQHLPTSAVKHSFQLKRKSTTLAERFTPHEVEITPGSRLAGILGSSVWTASAHHQAVDELGEGLRIVARAADGTVEAVEDPRRSVIGVQWHPEIREHGGEAQDHLFMNLLHCVELGRAVKI